LHKPEKEVNSRNNFYTIIRNRLKSWFANIELTFWNKTYVYVMADTIESLHQNAGNKEYKKAIKKLKKEIKARMECCGCNDKFNCILKKRGIIKD